MRLHLTKTLTDRVREVVADTLQIPEDQVREDSTADSLPSWDSLNHLNIMLAIEQHFEITLPPEEMERMTAIKTIAAVIEKSSRS